MRWLRRSKQVLSVGVFSATLTLGAKDARAESSFDVEWQGSSSCGSSEALEQQLVDSLRNSSDVDGHWTFVVIVEHADSAFSLDFVATEGQERVVRSMRLASCEEVLRAATLLAQLSLSPSAVDEETDVLSTAEPPNVPEDDAREDATAEREAREEPSRQVPAREGLRATSPEPSKSESREPARRWTLVVGVGLDASLLPTASFGPDLGMLLRTGPIHWSAGAG